MTKKYESYSKSFEKPDETRSFKAHGRFDVLNFPDGTAVGRGTFEPGWKWSSDVKPVAGTESCQSLHTGVCLSGKMTIKMDSGETFELKKGEAFHILPGHDAWVEGNETCTLVDMSGSSNYAKKAA